MLKLRLKRIGRKHAPSYRLVVMETTSRRDGRPVTELGWYDPIAKKCSLEKEKIKFWLQQGVKPTKTVLNILKKTEIIQTK